MRGPLCGEPVDYRFVAEQPLCALYAGHHGTHMPADPALRHGPRCAWSGQPVGQPSLNDDLCVCDPHGNKQRAHARFMERYRRRNVLWQDEVWYPMTGGPVRVKSMGLSYMQNVVAFLERRAPRLKRAYEWDLAFAPGVQGEHALDAVESILTRTMGMSPEEWLHDTPLVRRLDRRVRKQSKRALKEDFA